jgi:hypothetical protein
MLISVASWLKIDSPFGSTVILDVIVFMFLISNAIVWGLDESLIIA